MKTAIEDVTRFHYACNVPVFAVPCLPLQKRVDLRMDLIVEETVKELLPAMARGDLPKIADSLVDSLYVHIGAALEYGLPLQKIWDIVQECNMAKVDPITGKVRYREDGKVLKPDGWVGPDERIKKLLEEQMPSVY